MHITLRQLEAFHAIARLGSLTAAAAALSLSKGALSSTLQQLEGHLGQPLFDRQLNRLQLNSRGRALLPEVDSLLDRLRAIESGEQSATRWQELKLGASNTIGTYLLPPLLAHLHQQGNGSLPAISLANSASLAELLLSFTLDLALVEGEVRHNELLVTPWRLDSLVVIAPCDHPLADQQGLTPEILAAYPWVVREQGSGSRVQVEQLLRGQPWQPAVTLPSTEALVRTVAAGLGLGLVSSAVIANGGSRDRLTTLSLAEPRQRQLYLVRHRAKAGNPAIDALEQACRNAVSSLAAAE